MDMALVEIPVSGVHLLEHLVDVRRVRLGALLRALLVALHLGGLGGRLGGHVDRLFPLLCKGVVARGCGEGARGGPLGSPNSTPPLPKKKCSSLKFRKKIVPSQ